jgi:hypothetical protein
VAKDFKHNIVGRSRDMFDGYRHEPLGSIGPSVSYLKLTLVVRFPDWIVWVTHFGSSRRWVAIIS